MSIFVEVGWENGKALDQAIFDCGSGCCANYGAMGVGSAVSGLFAHRLLRRWSLPVRVMGAGALMVVFGLGLAATGVPLLLAVACFSIGLCVAPLLIAASTGTERRDFASFWPVGSVMSGRWA